MRTLPCVAGLPRALVCVAATYSSVPTNALPNRLAVIPCRATAPGLRYGILSIAQGATQPSHLEIS